MSCQASSGHRGTARCVLLHRLIRACSQGWSSCGVALEAHATHREGIRVGTPPPDPCLLSPPAPPSGAWLPPRVPPPCRGCGRAVGRPAGDLGSDAMPALEAVCRGPQPHVGADDLVGALEADEAVADVVGATVGVDVADPDEHIGIRQARTEPDLRAHVADEITRRVRRADVSFQGGRRRVTSHGAERDRAARGDRARRVAGP